MSLFRNAILQLINTSSSFFTHQFPNSIENPNVENVGDVMAEAVASFQQKIKTGCPPIPNVWTTFDNHVEAFYNSFCDSNNLSFQDFLCLLKNQPLFLPFCTLLPELFLQSIQRNSITSFQDSNGLAISLANGDIAVGDGYDPDFAYFYVLNQWMNDMFTVFGATMYVNNNGPKDEMSNELQQQSLNLQHVSNGIVHDMEPELYCAYLAHFFTQINLYSCTLGIKSILYDLSTQTSLCQSFSYYLLLFMIIFFFVLYTPDFTCLCKT